MNREKPLSFRSRFCSLYRVPDERFEREFVNLCAYPQARPFFRVFFNTPVRSITAARTLAQRVAQSDSFADVMNAVDAYRDDMRFQKTLGARLGFRISGRRVIEVCRPLVEVQPEREVSSVS